MTTKTESAKHLSEDIDIFSWSLSDEDMATLSAATSPSGSPSLMMKCSDNSFFYDEMEEAIDIIENEIEKIFEE